MVVTAASTACCMLGFVLTHEAQVNGPRCVTSTEGVVAAEDGFGGADSGADLTRRRRLLLLLLLL